MNLTKKEYGTIIFALEEYAGVLEKENSSAGFIYELIWEMTRQQGEAPSERKRSA